MKRILSLLGVLIVLGMAVIGCDDGGSGGGGGGGNGSEADDANTPKSAEWTGGNVVLTLTEIATPESSGVSAASGAAFSVSDPQPDETFHYTLSVGGTPVSNGTVKIDAASWEFAPATAGQQPFSATVSGTSLVFPAVVGGGISLPLKPNSGDNDGTKPAYGIALSEPATYEFPAATAGYAEQDGKVVTITNKGNQPTGDLTVTLSSGTAFTLDKTAVSSIAVNGSGAFTVTPKTGLGAGDYTDTVTVSGGVNIAAKSFNMSWTVNPSAVYFYSIADIIAYLDAQEGGKTAGDPVLLQLDINLSSATDGWDALMEALADSDKYVALDLSSCSMDGTEFDLNVGDVNGRKYIVSLVLPNAAASIASAFPDNGTRPTNNSYSKLRAISGANITAIGYMAFLRCASLTSISFPEATDISGEAFLECTSLTTVSFPEATSIGEWAFYGCTSLTSVSFPEATRIGGYVFNGCTSLTTVSFPKATTIDSSYPFSGAFNGCTSLTTVSIPEATSIGSYAFYGCTALPTVSFPKVTEIGNSSFSGCTSLKSVSFPEVITIGVDAFSDCTSLTSASFPKATAVYGFSGCTSLTSVLFPKATYISGGVFSGCTSLTSVSFPEATTIGGEAFYNCTALTEVSFPKVTIIMDSRDHYPGGAFGGCTSLSTLFFPELQSIGRQAFGYSGTKPLTITMGAVAPVVGYGMFEKVNVAKNVTVKVPTGAAGSYDATWKTAFKGDNTNINLLIEYY